MIDAFLAPPVVISLAVVALGAWLALSVIKELEYRKQNPPEAPALTPASQQPEGGGLLFPLVLLGVWLVVAAVVGATVIRLAWKVFQYAWS